MAYCLSLDYLRTRKLLSLILILHLLFFIRMMRNRHFIAPPSVSSTLFILGDSTVNCVNNSSISGSASITCGSQPILIPKFLAEKMGLKTVNYGSSPATIRTQLQSKPLNLQLQLALDMIKKLEYHMDSQEFEAFVSSSTFYISIGKDDYIRLFFQEFQDRRKHLLGSNRIAQILVIKIEKGVMDLYHAGVKKIVLMGIGPLGCSPRALYEKRGGGNVHCVDEINEFITEYNRVLSEKLTILRLELHDTRIVFCDVYKGMMKIITHPGRYGFKEVSRACCGGGRYGAEIPCESPDRICENVDSSRHVWWDFYNPTEAVNQLLVDSIWSNGNSLGQLCKPITVEKMT